MYVLTAHGWLKRLLVVVDKESLELKYVATGSRFLRRWDAIDPAHYADALKH